MPQVGEVRKAKEIGYKSRSSKCVWHACIDCGKQRWVFLNKGTPRKLKCPSCCQKGANNSNWRNWRGAGRRIVTKRGYVEIKLNPNDFFFPMAKNNGYVLEHRLVVAEALNRCLLPWEVVHHKGAKYPLGSIENKQDNRYPENLELIKGRGKHNTLIERELKKQAKQIEILQERVILLEAENILLRERSNISPSVSE